ncbi:MAG: GFA family protein [Pseudomonadota bacterium]
MNDLAGACLCGAVSWSANGAPLWSAYCHCESCKRNCAAPVAAFLGVADGAWSWTGAEPATYLKADVTRFFCNQCGTPMAYRAERYPGEIHFYTAHLTKGEAPPSMHVHHAEATPWMTIDDTLKRHARTALDTDEETRT